MGGLGFDVYDKTLYTMFSKFGRIASASVKTDNASGQSRGFGFVRFVEHSSAVRAIQVVLSNIFAISYLNGKLIFSLLHITFFLITSMNSGYEWRDNVWWQRYSS